MRPRLTVLLTLGALACGGRSPSHAPAPESMTETLAQFLSAVKANDLQRMGTLWGTDRGPAVDWMKPDQLKQRLTVIQKYLNHVGYRVVEGPVPVPGQENRRSYRVELQRQACNVVQPIELVRAKSGSWLVVDVHLETAGSPAAACKP